MIGIINRLLQKLIRNQHSKIQKVLISRSKISQIDRTYGIIMKLEDNVILIQNHNLQLNTLDEANISNEMVHLMDNVATTLESIQKVLFIITFTTLGNGQ